MAWEVLTMAPRMSGRLRRTIPPMCESLSRFLLEGCVKTRILPAHSFTAHSFKGDGGKFAVVDVAVAQVTRGEADLD